MKYVKEPWPHQERAINEAIRIYEEVQRSPDPASRQAGYGLYFEPRCGKSGTAINLFRYLCNRHGRKLKALVFCPPRVVPGWKFEFGIHSRVDPGAITLLRGSAVQREKIFRGACNEGGYVFVTNYESLLMEDLYDAFVSWKPEFIVWDESHRLKDIKAKRSKLAEKLSNPRELVNGEKLIRNAPYKLILSGSPVLNNPLDLYQQLKIMDGGETFSYYDYRTRRNEPLSLRGFLMTYFVDWNAGMPKERYFPDWHLKTAADGMDAMAEISKKLALKGMRVTRAEVLTLPPTSRVVIDVDMSQEQKKLYAEMKRDFITWHKGEAVTASLALTKSLRLLQITSGFVKTESGEEIFLENIPKQEALRELLTDILPSGKVIIWSVFKENYRQIREVCDALKVKYVEVTGEISSKKQDENVKRFQEDPEYKIFLGHPESGGEGLNLSVAPYIIFYSRTHSLKHSLQAGARNQSQDNLHPKTVRYDLVVRGTIDQAVADLVVAKEDMTREVYAELVLKNILESG